MNWYLAKLIFRIVCGEGKHTPQFDEQLRLVQATDSRAAYQKANSIGQQEQESFTNANDKLVSWHFITVSELYSLHQQMDGAEVYSRILEINEADDYILDIQHRSSNIFSGNLCLAD